MPFEAAFAFTDVKTHRVPLGINLFHPGGLSVSFKATYLNQSGNFEIREPPVPVFPDLPFVAGSTDFWVLDVAVRYRLPKRYGFLVFGASNLTDETALYQATDLRNPTIRPGRQIFGKVTLAFP